MPDINVNINGDDAERAAQAADEAALRAEAAAAAANASASRLQRAQASYGLPQFRQYQKALKQYGTTAGASWATQANPAQSPQGTVAPKAYTNPAAIRQNPLNVPTGWGGQPIQGGGVNNPLPGRQGGGAAPGGGVQPMAGWRQAGWGTNKVNFSGGTGIGGNFGKPALGGTGSAKARSVYNMATNLGKGTMPVIFRTSLAAWFLQKAAQIGGSTWELGMKGSSVNDSANTAALKFSANISDAITKQAAEIGRSIKEGGINLIKFGAMGAAGLAGIVAGGGTPGAILSAITGGGWGGTSTSGAVLQWSQKQIDKIENYWTGGSAFAKSMRARGAQDAALADAAAKARQEADKYLNEFADRNADELAALGFGTGATIRGIVNSSKAAQQLRQEAANSVLRQMGGMDIPEFEPSAGDD